MATKLRWLEVVYFAACVFAVAGLSLREAFTEQRGKGNPWHVEARTNSLQENADLLEELRDVLADEAPLLKQLREDRQAAIALQDDLELEKSDRAGSIHVLGPKEDLPPMVANMARSHREGPRDAAEDFERSVTDLIMGLSKMSKAELAATPMGDSVNKIKDLVTNTMEPKVKASHAAQQNELDGYAKRIAACETTRQTQLRMSQVRAQDYLAKSKLHKSCRGIEAVVVTDLASCKSSMKNTKTLADLACNDLKSIEERVGSQTLNAQIVAKAVRESTVEYLKRITGTIAGKGCGGMGGSGNGGFLDQYLRAKKKCDDHKVEYEALKHECDGYEKQLEDRRQHCDSVQMQMDSSSCAVAVQTKDACEAYSECYTSQVTQYTAYVPIAKNESIDRQAEWKGLKRIECLIKSFEDGTVSAGEVTQCKNANYATTFLKLNFTNVADMQTCTVPDTYPTTAAYLRAEFIPLPMLAKGNPNANECTGIMEISTKPRSGSPPSCKCERVTLNGPYEPGPMVKCTNCLDVFRKTETNSCPDGTKLFAPRTRLDWETFLSSALPLRDPNWIIDITRPQNGCGGCTNQFMNSGVAQQSTWRTSDGAPWWLRSKKYNEPNGDYQANCYLDLWHNPNNANEITWNDKSCSYHSRSYYCQRKSYSTTPKSGSPPGCACSTIQLAGAYSAKILLKCTNCLDVRKARDRNSCPDGTKLWSPATRQDWQTFLDSATPLRAPHWIIDVTRPQNGCGGCTRFAMNSGSPQQATWRTSDGSPWWLRSRRYGEPNGDYTANCYLDLWRTPTSANLVKWNDLNCRYHSSSYYCQPAQTSTR